LGVGLGIALAAGPAYAGGHALTATARPSGYTLEDMAQAVAPFSISGNNLDFYPDTPFQILYVDSSNVDPSTGTNTFTVSQGTKLFVPVLFFDDDSPPILGDFPVDSSTVEEYFFSEEQIGAHDLQIEVDGRVTWIGEEYAAGPVVASDLPDGGSAHYVQVGAFLNPLSKGRHTVTIRGTVDGDAVPDNLAGPFETSYTVIVR
jgi:hypothetical protein